MEYRNTFLRIAPSDKMLVLGTLGFFFLFSLGCKSSDQEFWKSTLNKVNIFGNELNYTLMFVILGITDVWFGEIIKRFLVFLGELLSINTRYDGKILPVIQQSFCTKSNIPFLTLPIVVAMMTYLNLHGEGMLFVWRIIQTKWNCVLIITIALFARLLRLNEPTRSEMARVLEEQKLNVGHGLAWSFYFGYLRLIIPGLQSRIESWKPSIQNTKRYKVIPKLYILVPKSCYCPPSITAADPRLKVAGVTPSFVANRAGNQRREYKNTMYCFEADNVEYYCMVEYATPVLSLYEMSNSEEAGLSSHERLQQMNTFVSTLTEIIHSNPETKNYCSLVVYDDKDFRDGEQRLMELLKDRIERDLRDRAVTKTL